MAKMNKIYFNPKYMVPAKLNFVDFIKAFSKSV